MAIQQRVKMFVFRNIIQDVGLALEGAALRVSGRRDPSITCAGYYSLGILRPSVRAGIHWPRLVAQLILSGRRTFSGNWRYDLL